MNRVFKIFKRKKAKDTDQDTSVNPEVAENILCIPKEGAGATGSVNADFDGQVYDEVVKNTAELPLEGETKLSSSSTDLYAVDPTSTQIHEQVVADVTKIQKSSEESKPLTKEPPTEISKEISKDQEEDISKSARIDQLKDKVGDAQILVSSNQNETPEQRVEMSSVAKTVVDSVSPEAKVVSNTEESTTYHKEEASKSVEDSNHVTLLVPEGKTLSETSIDRLPEKKFLHQTITSYDQIPVLEQTKLPRGGVSVDTKAVGRVQFGIPPETIKDSMRMGIPVPQVYIVPVERFCREMGPALGVNLAEFEFPAYFNFFVYKKRCTLVVDSEDAEDNIRRVFSETLLGPAQFLRAENPLTHEPEDFDPDFPAEMIPDFQKEFHHFRIMPDGKELVIETLLDFCHFKSRSDGHSDLGIPPSGDDQDSDDSIGEVDALGENDLDSSEKEETLPTDAKDLEQREKKKVWTYSQTRFMGEVAVVWPPTATEEEKKNRSVPRVEVFKMPGGTEYVLHDVDINNHIIGKARLSGHVKVSENLRVDGFGGLNLLDELKPKLRSQTESGKGDASRSTPTEDSIVTIPPVVPPPSFHPPSFGVTVLGNSHGFDASGSVSGYVLWINGRGVMIDPPPYASATLEREGIRPRTIVGIIITHCHADHDAGTFQKILTGSPVVLITTPTIYKSFIRKYAALSALSPALLRHSHRYKPAIIGQPLRFQGAVFKFTYSLHTIPCVGFRVEWRGKSIVFTADHFNSPPAIDKLQEAGILSKGRADDLRNIPMQHCDLLLHEAGAPPIHTPLDVLMQLPPDVKKRLYVVHTAKLPEGSDLQAAPTGTAGTLRLDEHLNNCISTRSMAPRRGSAVHGWTTRQGQQRDYYSMSEEGGHVEDVVMANLPLTRSLKGYPLVALRPASSTDAWFILNLMSAVPFISSLSYQSTMELLEIAKVDVYEKDEVVIAAARRQQLLGVIWEGTCSEKAHHFDERQALGDNEVELGVWHAGDWTGPIALQPEKSLSGESKTSSTHDIVAVSKEGVKIITIDYSSLHTILKHGSELYRKYLERTGHLIDFNASDSKFIAGQTALPDLNVLELLNCNSALRKLSAVQKRHVESLAEGPITFMPYEKMWQSGAIVDRAFIIVSGTAFFQVRRGGGGASITGDRDAASEFGDSVKADAMKVMKDLERAAAHGHHSSNDDYSDMSSIENDDSRYFSLELFGNAGALTAADSKDLDLVMKGLQARANHLSNDDSTLQGDESNEGDNDAQLAPIFIEGDPGTVSHRSSVLKRRGSRARIANKVLGRLYNRRAFTSGLVFSRGHFLGDVSKMVAESLAVEGTTPDDSETDGEDGPLYGFGEGDGGESKKNVTISDQTIPEQRNGHSTVHTSTLTAGKSGCVALVFPKSTLTLLLDEYPGLLLSLLGTQVVV